MRVLLVVLGGILLLSTPAFAQHLYGKDLVRLMQDLEKEHTENWYDAGVFSGFVIGVYDANKLSLSKDGQISMVQVCSIVANYLKQHPESLDKPGYVLVVQALQDAFPDQGVGIDPAGQDNRIHK